MTFLQPLVTTRTPRATSTTVAITGMRWMII
jgi:hypothetical protein